MDKNENQGFPYPACVEGHNLHSTWFKITEKEKNINISKYNHDLFKNMIYFMDSVWEINIHTGLLAVLSDKENPEQNGQIYNYEDIYNIFINDRVREKDLNTFKEYMSFENLKKDREEISFEIRLKEKDGTYNRHKIVITPAFDDDGSLYSVYLSSRNLQGEEQHLMEEYRNLLQFMDSLMSNSPFNLTFDVSGDGLIHEDFVTSNGHHPIQEYTGMELPVPFESFFKKWYELCEPQFEKQPDEDIFTIDYLKRSFERNEHIIDIVVNQKSFDFSDTYKYMQIFIALSQNPADKHIYAHIIWRDISSFRRMVIENNLQLENNNKELKKAYETANKSSSAKTNFLSQMSNDLRTPMNTIIGMTAIAQRHIDDQERIETCLSKITEASRYMLGLLNEIVDMSNIESKTLKLEKGIFNIRKTLDNLLVLCRTMSREYEHAFTITTHGIIHEHVIGDSIRLQQIFMNIAGNAIKYTPKGGKISVNVTERLTEKEGYGCYHFIFTDNGIGMPPDFMEHVFEPFCRAKDHRAEKVQGGGLGLPIAKTLVEMMDGQISVESALDNGTTVNMFIYLRLPEKKEEDEWDDSPVFMTKEEFEK